MIIYQYALFMYSNFVALGITAGICKSDISYILSSVCLHNVLIVEKSLLRWWIKICNMAIYKYLL